MNTVECVYIKSLSSR